MAAGRHERRHEMTEVLDDACGECLRRGWLLNELSKLLDYSRGDVSKLLGLFALDDERLIRAIAGRRRAELTEHWERFERDVLEMKPGVESVCKHNPSYPLALREPNAAPRMLYVVGGRERLARLTAKPIVAIVGSQRPTDYGIEMARSLARGMAASGVTIVSGLANGIAAAAHAGALEVDGPTVTVMAGGVDVIKPTSRRGLYERITASGCAVAELPCTFQPQRWCEPARARTIASLARLTIVVEADDDPRELIGARAARVLGQTVAALPGEVTSPVSRGTNRLLMEDAPMVRGPADALDLLHTLSWPHGNRYKPIPPEPPKLEPRLQAILEQVGAGRDTPNKLISTADDADETMLALTELELKGLLARGDGGRYVPRQSLAAR
jgi:DNA processing protein